MTVRPEPLLGVFGEKLRKQREQRGLEIDAISNTTKISPRMLRALEEEHFDQLPGGVFNKGFVRAYARQVGLNEEEAVADYLEALRESQIQQQSILPDFRAPMGKPAAPLSSPRREPNHENGVRFSAAPSPINHTPAEAHAADLIDEDRGNDDPHTEGAIKEDRLRNRNDDRGHRDAVVFPTQGFITGPAIDSQTMAPVSQVPWRKLAAGLFAILLLLAFWNLHRRAHASLPTSAAPVAASASLPVVPNSQPSAPNIAVNSGNTRQPGREESSAAAVKSVVAPSPKPAAARPAATQPPLPTHLPVTKIAPVVKPPSSFTLLIRAEKTTWVAITADGKPVAHETLIAPAQTSVRATKEIVVRVGNAAGVNFLLNGKQFSASGSEGEVKTYVFNSFGYHLQP